MTKIDAKYLTKVYKNGAYGLKGCSFSAKDGEFLVIVGGSGEGKSTLLKVLAGTEKLSSGELYFDGILAENISTAQRSVSMVFQEYVLYPHLTVFDNLATPLKLEGVDEKVIYDRVMATLAQFGLELAADVKPKKLSGGEQQRVALAKALLKRSKLVLLDEPMSNVDEKSRWEYCRLLKDLKQMLPESTFIYVTHNTKEAAFLADRIAVMHNGSILEIASTDLIFSHPQNRITTQMLGISDTTVKSAFDENGHTRNLSYRGIFFDGELRGSAVTFALQTIELSEEYMSRLLYRPQNALIYLSIDKLSKTMLSNSFSLVFEVVENCGDYVIMRTEDRSFAFDRKTALKARERIRLYYKTDDLIIYDGDKRATCHYPLHNRIKIGLHDAGSGRVEILGKRIKLKRAIPENAEYVAIDEEAFELSFERGRCSVLIDACLDEEIINGKKLMHVAIKGEQGYLSFMAKEEICCFTKQKVYLNIYPDKLKFKEKEV